MSTGFIRFLEDLEYYKSFFIFEKWKKIKDSPLKNQADGQPTYNERQLATFNLGIIVMKALKFVVLYVCGLYKGTKSVHFETLGCRIRFYRLSIM